MKLREAIKNKDYSLFKKAKYPSFYNYYDTLSEILYPDGYHLDSDHHMAVENSGRVEQYAVREWLCTDTHVGLYLYLIDGEAVCIMYQSGRKTYPDWRFFSVDTLQKTKNLFEEYKPAKDLNTDNIGVDENLLELWLDKNLFESGVTNEQMGLSPLLEFKEYIESVMKGRYILDSYFKSIFTEALAAHHRLLKYYQDKGDIESIERLNKDVKEIVKYLDEVLVN